MAHEPSASRYDSMIYERCGRSGLKLPRVSLGLWHNFGADGDVGRARRMILRAFDLGITHFDLANNYGPPPGSAEETFGRVLSRELSGFRDELIISTKAGYDMWPGPYGEYGSRKYLIASLDQSLRRMGLDYVDIFYHHCPDPETPLDETMGALAHIVQSGKALYVGVSNYDHEQTREALAILEAHHHRLLIHQPSYSLLNRWCEANLLPELSAQGLGCIAFSPLSQGLLSSRYLEDIPRGSRAAGASRFLNPGDVTEALRAKLRGLNEIARARQQSLAQMAIAWVLRRSVVTSALIGASRPAQIEECVRALSNLQFSDEELSKIDRIAAGVV